MRRCFAPFVPCLLFAASCSEPGGGAPEGTTSGAGKDGSTSTATSSSNEGTRGSSTSGTATTSLAESSSGARVTTGAERGSGSESGSSASGFAESSSTGDGLLVEDDTCVKPQLSERELDWVDVFDGIDASIGGGEGYSESDNSLGVLGNNQPSIMKGYIDAYLATREFRYLRKLITQGDRILAARDDMTGALDYTGGSYPIWGNANPGYQTSDVPYAFGIESGELAAPLAYVAYIIRDNPCLHETVLEDGRTLLEIAEVYATEMAKVAAYHGQTWTEDTQGGLDIGFYREFQDATFLLEGGGRPWPVNYQSALGKLLASLYLATGDSAYLDDAQRVSNMLLLEFEYDPSIDGVTYRYWPQMTYYPESFTHDYTHPDDLSHAVITYEFMYMMYAHGLGSAYEVDVTRLTNAFTQNFYVGYGLFHLSIDGTTLSTPETVGYLYQVGSYAMLGTLDPAAHDIAEETMIDVLGVDQPGAWGSAGSLTGIGRLLRYEPG